MQAHLDLLAVLIKIRIVALIIMTDVKAEAEGAKQVSWFDPTLKDLIISVPLCLFQSLE